MDVAPLGRGLLIGLLVAAPVGAIGILCIRRTLAAGRLVGFLTGLGAATADACYGAVAALGMTSVSGVLIAHQGWVRVAGGLALGYLGVRTVRASADAASAASAVRGLASAYGSTVALTLANPGTILTFAAIFAGAGFAAADRVAAALLILGVFLGSALWWLILSSVVGLLRHRCTPPRLRWVNRLAGAALVAFGVIAVASAFNR